MSPSVRHRLAAAFVRTLPGTPLLAATLLAACGPAGPIHPTYALTAPGGALPAFALPALDGGVVSARGLHGRPAVVSLWSTHCPHGRGAFAATAALDSAYRARGVAVVLLAGDDAATLHALETRARSGLRIAVAGEALPALFDRSAHAPERRTHRVAFVLPSHLVVDARGRVVHRGFGDDLGAVRRVLDSLLAPAAAGAGGAVPTRRATPHVRGRAGARSAGPSGWAPATWPHRPGVPPAPSVPFVAVARPHVGAPPRAPLALDAESTTMTNEGRPGRELPVLGQDGMIDRRTFLRGTLEASALALLAAACSGGGEPTSPFPEPAPGQAPNLDVSVSLAAVPQLAAVGGVALQGAGRRTFALVRTASDQFRAFSMICPHEGTIVGVIRDAAGAFVRFQCPNHSATFSTSGVNTGGQRTGSLRALTTQFDAAAGTVRVTGFV